MTLSVMLDSAAASTQDRSVLHREAFEAAVQHKQRNTITPA
jgi:hypothetical protein